MPSDPISPAGAAATAAATTAARPAAAPAAVVILGADAILAALPATAVQLFQACLRAGYQSAVPATWGDELVAEGCLTELERRGGRPLVCCSCPIVAARLTGAGPELSHALVPLLAPPVAAARYLRLKLRPTPLHVTYVGACPITGDTSIDQQLSPAELLATLTELGIRVDEQPTTFDDVLPPDRRRHLSLPGGLPTPEALAMRGLPHRLVQITGADYATELAEQLMGGEALLLDVAPRLGCACSGAVEGMAPANARAVVMALEPPRSPRPVIDNSVVVDVRGSLPASPPRPEPPLPVAAAASGQAAGRSGRPEPQPASFVSPRRPTPPGGRLTVSVARGTPVGVTRQWAGAFPKARSGDGRLLPRAYVARRHSFSTLTPIPEHPPLPEPPGRDAAVATATPPEGHEFALFVAGLTAVVARHVTPTDQWRQRLDEAIAHWRAAGYDTAVLQRARALPAAPDVDGLLDTFAGAADHLGRLEALASTVRPSLRGAPIFRDPRNVKAAESLVDGLLGEAASCPE